MNAASITTPNFGQKSLAQVGLFIVLTTFNLGCRRDSGQPAPSPPAGKTGSAAAQPKPINRLGGDCRFGWPIVSGNAETCSGQIGLGQSGSIQRLLQRLMHGGIHTIVADSLVVAGSALAEAQRVARFIRDECVCFGCAEVCAKEVSHEADYFQN